MSQTSVVTLLLLALTLAIQPWSVLASILLVTSHDGVRKTIAFVAGWAVALTAVAVVAILVAPSSATSTTKTVQYGIEIAAGAVLLAWLLVRWRRTRGHPGNPPAWMGRVDGMGAFVAIALGAFLPNYLVVVAAVNELVLADVHGGALVAAVAAFVVVASLGVAAPLVVLAVDRRGARRRLERWHTWLTTHSRDVLYAVGVVVAVVLIVKGTVGLAGS